MLGSGGSGRLTVGTCKDTIVILTFLFILSIAARAAANHRMPP